jgi:hypothetical protein
MKRISVFFKELNKSKERGGGRFPVAVGDDKGQGWKLWI